MQRCSLSKCASCKKVGLWQRRHCHWKYYTQWMEREGGREGDREGERRRGGKKNAGGFRKRESFEHTTKKGKEKWSTKRERNRIDRVNSSWTLSRIVFFPFFFFFLLPFFPFVLIYIPPDKLPRTLGIKFLRCIDLSISVPTLIEK